MSVHWFNTRTHRGTTLYVPYPGGLPPRLYHFTTLSAWAQICGDGYLYPAPDRWDEQLFGIWAVEPGNFRANWLAAEFEGEPPCCHVIEQACQKLDANDEVAVLCLQTHARTDRLWVRDLRALLLQGDPRRFVRSLKPLADCTLREYRQGCLEFIFSDPVPVERARLMLSFPAGDGHRRHQTVLGGLK